MTGIALATSIPPVMRRPAPGGSGNTHHPVSRVRYRDSAPSDGDYRDYRDESRQPRR